MGFIDGYVKSPFAGIAPWILLSVLSGPGRFEEAASAALGLSLLTLWVGWRRAIPVHLLEVFGVAFFGVMAGLGLVASDGMIQWLESWAGEVSNVALAGFAIITLLIKRPFTVAYAKDTTPEEYWDTAQFLKVNYAISAVWAAAFTFSAIVGAIGGIVLHGEADFWTGWILPIGAMLFAVEFTEFYPDYAGADEPESRLRLLDWLPPFVLVVGIVGWVSESTSAAVGITLIVVGIAGSALMGKTRRVKT
ncbi:hypothetical protein MARA_34020 [Mycolicibacterium arabiense]|uniref:Uncharacterized protein n=1 Tax=Mycolicibacterium arabiense TaxID=1286181 RepID=A0A7I7RZ57_9MYCO|nr:hypothetical protein [Mycolicibacterium arabiense]MCV7371238.1 hypothetical protein [Mycolicibacterium arabiense]BBY49934.1 hypothetical protein MARA_34020 [Mycolicibacterium arabiense]